MTVRLRLTDPDAVEEAAGGSDEERAPPVDTDAIRVASGVRARLGVEVGDPVRVEGDDVTVATVGPDMEALPPDRALAGSTVELNAGAETGSPVAVEAVTTTAAESVSLASADSSVLDGDTDALSRVLSGRYVTPGDRIDAALFGGSVVVSLRVLDADADGPAEVTSETDLSVRRNERPVDGGELASMEPGELGGLAEERATLRRLVVDPLTGGDSYAEAGLRTPAGVLVTGPTGTGKSSLVRSVAAEADLPVHEVAPGDCGRRGSLAAALRAAADEAPAVLFVEDLARAAPDPDGDPGSAQRSAMGWLLDRVAGRDDLVVVGETTRPDGVDPELRRGGRFDGEVRFGVPGPAERAEILAVLAADLRLDDDVDLDGVAARTHGYTGADLEAVLVDAVSRAVTRGPPGPVTVRGGDLAAALDAVRPATLRGVTIERPDVRYDDIGGLEAAKREVVRTVEWPLAYPRLFERLAVDAPAGVLLSGPPGTGKTMLARAVANSTSANFLAVDGPELMNRYVGESERGVRTVFERARRLAPSVVFLDELDALAPARGETDTGAAERVVSQLLTELDGLSPRGEVVVLAATNRPDAIDPALLRPGRIETRVSVPLPDRADRGAILRVHLADVPTRGVDVDAIAERTAGYTGSDLAGVVREAALTAAEGYLRERAFEPGDLDDVAVEQAHLRRALDRIRPSVDSDRT